MTSLTLSFFGPPEQKHVVKVTPMQTLKDVLHSASSKFKPALVAEQCDLQLNKKAVDLNTPFRLLNIPAGSKLEFIKRTSAPAPAAGAPVTAAAATSTAKSTAAQAAAPALAAEATSSPAAVAAAAGAPSNNVGTAAQPPAVGNTDHLNQVASSQDPAAAAQLLPSSLAAVSAAAGQSELSTAAAAAAAADASTHPAAAAAANPSPSPAAAAAAATTRPSSSPAAAAAAVQPELAALGIQRPIYVFHQRALEAAAEAAAHSSSSAMDVDPPDEFFDLTAEDLARMQQQANAKKQQQAVFRTRAARDAEDARAAAALGPVRVRLHWPDGTLIQSEFKATEPLSAVQDLVSNCSATQYAPALYLYTTPPKTVIKDSAASLYGLKLVPAAHIYIGIDDKKVASGAAVGGKATGVAGGLETQPRIGGLVSTNTSRTYLRPEVQALMQDHVPEQIQQQQQQQQNEAGADDDRAGGNAAAVAEAQRAMRVAAAASRAEARGGDAAGGNKVPKWLKVGKK